MEKPKPILKNMKDCDWNKFFIEIAELACSRCRDDCNIREGAVITKVYENKRRILGVGWNGLPRHVLNVIKNNEEYMIPAIENAIIFSNVGIEDFNDVIIYATRCPNLRSVVFLHQFNIKKVKYESKPKGQDNKKIKYESKPEGPNNKKMKYESKPEGQDNDESRQIKKFPLFEDFILIPINTGVNSVLKRYNWNEYFEELATIAAKYTGQGVVVVKNDRIVEMGWYDCGVNAITYALRDSKRRAEELENSKIYSTYNPSDEESELIKNFKINDVTIFLKY